MRQSGLAVFAVLVATLALSNAPPALAKGHEPLGDALGLPLCPTLSVAPADLHCA